MADGGERVAELPGEVPAPADGGTARARVVAVLRVVLAVAIAGGVVYAVASQWSDVRHTMMRLSWPWVLGAVLVTIGGHLANTMAWRAALADLGGSVGFRGAARVCLIGQLGKYLPGTVWEFVLQMELGKRAGVPRSRSLLAGLIAAGLGVTAGLVLGAFELPELWHAAHRPVLRVAVGVLVAAVPVALVCAHPRVLTALTRLALRLTRREPLDAPLSWRGVGVTTGWNAVGRVAYGVQLWLLLRAVTPIGAGGLLACVGAFSLAFTAGLLVVVSPSGLGAREAVLTAVLLPLLPGGEGAGTALGLVIASRVVFTVADLAGAGGAALLSLPRRRLSAQSVGVSVSQEAPRRGRVRR